MSFVDAILGDNSSEFGLLLLGFSPLVSTSASTTWNTASPLVHGAASANSVTTISATGHVIHNGVTSADSTTTISAIGSSTTHETASASCETTISAVGGFLRFGTATAQSVSTIGGGTNTFVQSNNQAFTLSPVARSLSFNSSVTAGNFLVVVAPTFGGASVTVSDNLNGSYTQAGTYAADGSERISVWYFANTAGGSCTITVTPSGSDYVSIICLEYSGVLSSSPFEAYVTNNFNANTTPNVASFGSSRDLLIAAYTQGSHNISSSTVDSPFTSRAVELDGTSFAGYQVSDYTNASGATATTFHLSSSCEWAAIGVAFRPTAQISGLLTHNAIAAADSVSSISANGVSSHGVFGAANIQSNTTISSFGNLAELADATVQSVSTISGVAKVTHKDTVTIDGVSSSSAVGQVNHFASATAICKATVNAPSQAALSGAASVRSFSSVVAISQVNVVEATASVQSFTTFTATSLLTHKAATSAVSPTTITAVGKVIRHGIVNAQCKTTISASTYTAVASARCVSAITITFANPTVIVQNITRISAVGQVNHYAAANIGSKTTITPAQTVIRVLPDYNNTVLWLMGDAGTTVDGNTNISNWADQSSVGTHAAAQVSTFARPAYIAGALNGLPIARFNGTGTFFNVSNSTFMLTQFWTIIALVKDARVDNNERDVISNVAVSSLASAIYLATIGTSPTQARMTDYFGGSLDPLGNTTGEGVLDIVDTDTNGYFIYVGLVDHSYAPTLYEGDRVIASDNAHSIPARDFSPAYTVGRRGGLNQNYWKGDIAELIVWNDQLSYSQVQSVVNYLKSKWFGSTVVNRTRTATWNCFEATHVDVGPSTSWDVFILPAISASTTWNNAQNPPTTVDAGPQSTIWKVRKKVIAGPDNPMSTTWNVLHRPITDVTIDTTWNVLHRSITDVTIDTTWNVENKVLSSSPSTTWNVLRRKQKFHTALWDDDKLIDVGPQGISWNVLTHPSISASPTWNVRRLVDLIAFPVVHQGGFMDNVGERSRWNVLNDGVTLTTNLQQYAEWDVHVTTSKAEIVLWKVRVHVDKTGVVRFNDRILVNLSPNAIWNVRKHAGRTHSTFWNVLHLSALRTVFWNVDVTVGKTIRTTWQSIKDNNSGRYTLWNVDVVAAAGTRTAMWNMLPTPVKVLAAALWNDRKEVPDFVITTWNVNRAKRFTRNTYWNVISGLIDCESPIPKQRIDIIIHVRWHTLSNSGLTLIRVVRWGTRHIQFGAAKQGNATWRVKTTVDSPSRNTIWRITAFTTDKTTNTTWDVLKIVSRTHLADFNVHMQLVGGGPQRVAKWNVRVTSAHGTGSNQSQTTWNVNKHVDEVVSTEWKASIRKQSQATWDVRVTTSKQSQAIWDVGALSSKQSQATWDVLKIAEKEASTTWWYSTVTIGPIGTAWNNKVKVVPADPGIATLWDNFPQCSEEFIQAAYRGAKGGAILSKITVCEIAKDYKKYRSKYDKTHPRRKVKTT